MSSQGVTISFKQEVLEGIHDLSLDTLFVALYEPGANLDTSSTSAYQTADEFSGSGYDAGGIQLENVSLVVDNDRVVLTFSTVAWDALTGSVRQALIYNASQDDRAVAVYDFGTDITLSNQPFVLRAPNIADGYVPFALR